MTRTEALAEFNRILEERGYEPFTEKDFTDWIITAATTGADVYEMAIDYMNDIDTEEAESGIERQARYADELPESDFYEGDSPDY